MNEQLFTVFDSITDGLETFRKTNVAHKKGRKNNNPFKIIPKTRHELFFVKLNCIQIRSKGRNTE